MNKTSDYIPFDLALKTGFELLTRTNVENSVHVIGFYIIFSINCGLRVSDVLSLQHSDIRDKKAKQKIHVREKKTGKLRIITLNTNIIDAYKLLVKDQILEGDVFVSRKGTYTARSMNRLLKDLFPLPELNVSTHSLRKCFGRRYFEQSGETDKSLIILNQIFKHNNMATTKIYLGLTADEISEAYMSL